MKKLILAICLVMSSSAWAYDRHHIHYQHRHHHHHHNNSAQWAVPLIAGVVIGAVVARQHTQQPAPVVVEQVRVVPRCSDWREYEQWDGTVIRERICRQ
jgi:hypothetical protein